MSGTKQLMCECGQAVTQGSVFCQYCKTEIQKKNAQVIKKEESSYQKKLNSLAPRK